MKYHPIYYALIPDLAQAEKVITALDAKILEIKGEEIEEELEMKMKKCNKDCKWWADRCCWFGGKHIGPVALGKFCETSEGNKAGLWKI